MSIWPALSALNSTTQTFPVLTEAQIERVRPLATLRKVAPGEVLFEPGNLRLPFEEGNAFEADAVEVVEKAESASEVRTRQVPEDDVPAEYLTDDDENAA